MEEGLNVYWQVVQGSNRIVMQEKITNGEGGKNWTQKPAESGEENARVGRPWNLCLFGAPFLRLSKKIGGRPRAVSGHRTGQRGSCFQGSRLQVVIRGPVAYAGSLLFSHTLNDDWEVRKVWMAVGPLNGTGRTKPRTGDP